MGDLFVGLQFPFIDVDGGGHAGEWVETLDEILRVVPADATLIPGHGEIGTVKDLKYFRDYITELRVQVGKAVKAGKTLQETIDSVRVDKYDRIQPWFRKLENNVGAVYREFKSGK